MCRKQQVWQAANLAEQGILDRTQTQNGNTQKVEAGMDQGGVWKALLELEGLKSGKPKPITDE